MNLNKIVADRLKSLRKDKNLTQTDMANLLNVTQNAIFRYESGQNEPSLSTILFYSEYFNVSIDYLLGNDHQTASPPAEKMPKDMKKYLEQSEVIFDGDVYHLDDEGREMVRQALKMAFLAAKEANKRKKK